MIRLYGSAPYRAIFLHGGPGAIGSLQTCAATFSQITGIGVMEPLQSQYSIAALIEELYMQITEHCSEMVTLIGHSWGAWLALLFTEKYPEQVNQIILVGCPPLDANYVHEISVRRVQCLMAEERDIFQRMLAHSATDADLMRMPQILEHTDNYCLSNDEQMSADYIDSEMYNSVWQEAENLRANGALLSMVQNLKCPITLLQGVQDPHPVQGVIAPLQKIGIPCTVYLLEQCGHTPFAERYAKDRFYQILRDLL